MQAAAADVYEFLINPDSKPFKYVDEAGRISGIDADILDSVAHEGGFIYKLVQHDFDTILQDVADCKADAAISALSVTAERAEGVLFSSPYLSGNQHIYVRMMLGDETSLASELIQKVGVKGGTTAELHISGSEAEYGISIEKYPDYASLFDALNKGDIDAVVADEYLAKPFADEYDVMVIGDPISVEVYAVAVCPEKPELLEKVNAGLDAIRENGVLDYIILDNLSVSE